MCRAYGPGFLNQTFPASILAPRTATAIGQGEYVPCRHGHLGAKHGLGSNIQTPTRGSAFQVGQSVPWNIAVALVTLCLKRMGLNDWFASEMQSVPHV